jgi:hypothetical protein
VVPGELQYFLYLMPAKRATLFQSSSPVVQPFKEFKPHDTHGSGSETEHQLYGAKGVKME